VLRVVRVRSCELCLDCQRTSSRVNTRSEEFVTEWDRG
jgi:hypothetical protein